MDNSPTIFLSYTHVDKSTARRVVQALQDRKLDVWWDEHIQPLSMWQDELSDKLMNCSTFVVLIGDQGISGWVKGEVGVALNRHFSRNAKKPLSILPVLLDGSTDERIPPFLSLFQFFQLNDTTDTDQLSQLVHALTGVKPDDFHIPELPFKKGECPFPGLAPFDSRHQSLFLGRHTDLHEILERFSEQRKGRQRKRWLRIEGNSGLGKSSFLRAGVLPALQKGWLDLGDSKKGLRILPTMRPGHEPLFELAHTLAIEFNEKTSSLQKQFEDPDFKLATIFADHIPDTDNQLPVLIVDQFEELFTLSKDQQQQRQRFDQLLAEAIENKNFPMYLVTTMRSDFTGKFDFAPQLSAQRKACSIQFELGPVDESGLLDIVKRSVQIAGLQYSDDQLPDDILDEARPEPGALPLISHLLRQLWQANNNTLHRERYKGLGSTLEKLSVRVGPM